MIGDKVSADPQTSSDFFANDRRVQSEWEVLLPDRHEGYIPWEEFERNQRLIADNANSKALMARGSVRRGDALLAGLLRCGHCGRRLHVPYSGTVGFCVRYYCRGAHLNHATERCIAFGGLRVDAAVSAELLQMLAPLGIEAALCALDTRAVDNSETHRQAELPLTQARYEAGLARRQYDAVDPDNRLVAAELVVAASRSRGFTPDIGSGRHYQPGRRGLYFSSPLSLLIIEGDAGRPPSFR